MLGRTWQDNVARLLWTAGTWLRGPSVLDLSSFPSPGAGFPVRLLCPLLSLPSLPPAACALSLSLLLPPTSFLESYHKEERLSVVGVSSRDGERLAKALGSDLGLVSFCNVISRLSIMLKNRHPQRVIFLPSRTSSTIFYF